MINKTIDNFKKVLLWQRIFILVIISILIYFLVSLSLYSSWNRNIYQLRDENQDLLLKIDRADELFEKKAEISDAKAEIIKDLVLKTSTESRFLSLVKGYCSRNGIRIDLLDTFTVIKEYEPIIRKRYVMKLKVSRFDQIHLLMRYMTARTIFRILKFEYDNGYLDLELDILFSK